MAANVQPVFALKPETKTAVITGTTTDKSGATPANLVELVTGSTDGTKVTWIKFKHVGNSTAGLYLIFITDPSGSNPRLYAELQITAQSSSVNQPSHESIIYTIDLQLKVGQKILVGSTTLTTNVHVTASIGEFS